MISINWMPVCVGKICFLFRMMYCRLKSVSIIFARVEGRPIPFSFINSRSSSSSICFPAVSMARSKVASENKLGGFVAFSRKDGSCGPFSPFMKFGRMSVSNFSAVELSWAEVLALSGAEVSKTTRHPFSKISFPVVLKVTSAAIPITAVFETVQSS